MPTPLLSICIPTFNRSRSLELLLDNIKKECAEHLGQIEIAISDNGSTDDTEAVVQRRKDLPIVYKKKSHNTGGAHNILSVAAEVASGEFTWIIGDDDFILPGGVARILESIQNNPDIDYHYLNFGWITSTLRNRLIEQEGQSIPPALLKHLQCDVHESRRLSQLEDLALLPGTNPSALFCCIFSFVTRRTYFTDALQWIRPTYCTDGSTTKLDDWYPHAMATVPRAVGKPIAYIGAPCLLQSIGAWEWKSYLNKAIIFGIYELLKFLAGQGFDRASMNHLWRSYYATAGRIFARMQCDPHESLGLETLLKESIPHSASKKIFWKSFMDEMRVSMQTDFDADILARHAKQIIKKNPLARIGMWGVQGRNYCLLKNHEGLRKNIVWITDRETHFHGERLENSTVAISAPASLADAQIDCLIVGTRRKFISSIMRDTRDHLPAHACFITVDGVTLAGPRATAKPVLRTRRDK